MNWWWSSRTPFLFCFFSFPLSLAPGSSRVSSEAPPDATGEAVAEISGLSLVNRPANRDIDALRRLPSGWLAGPFDIAKTLAFEERRETVAEPGPSPSREHLETGSASAAVELASVRATLRLRSLLLLMRGPLTLNDSPTLVSEGLASAAMSNFWSRGSSMSFTQCSE